MKTITKNAINYFDGLLIMKNKQQWKSGNMLVSSCYSYSDELLINMYLHYNLIAQLTHLKGTLLLRDCGRRTQTTKERLNGILEHFNLGRIFQHNGDRFFQDVLGNVKDWNGMILFENINRKDSYTL